MPANLVKVYHAILFVDREGRAITPTQTNLVNILTGRLTFESLVLRIPGLGRRFARVQSFVMNGVLKFIECFLTGRFAGITVPVTV